MQFRCWRPNLDAKTKKHNKTNPLDIKHKEKATICLKITERIVTKRESSNTTFVEK